MTIWGNPMSSGTDFLSKRIDFPGGSDGKAFVYNVGDPGSIPGLGRSPGEGNGNPLQYYCLENPMDRGDWQATIYGVAKSQTRLSDFTFTFTIQGEALFFPFCSDMCDDPGTNPRCQGPWATREVDPLTQKVGATRHRISPNSHGVFFFCFPFWGGAVSFLGVFPFHSVSLFPTEMPVHKRILFKQLQTEHNHYQPH